MAGGVDVLNVALGDLKLQFNKDNPVESERARRAVTQMLRAGYTIFIAVDGKLKRVDNFDESCDCYVITDVPAGPPQDAPPENQDAGAGEGTRDPGKRRGGRPRKVPAEGTTATAIAPRAGG